MLEGVHLTLMIGPAVPVPAPRVVMDALRSISVTSGKDRSGFQITFAVGRDSPLLKAMLPAGYFDPITTRVLTPRMVLVLPVTSIWSVSIPSLVAAR